MLDLEIIINREHFNSECWLTGGDVEVSNVNLNALGSKCVNKWCGVVFSFVLFVLETSCWDLLACGILRHLRRNGLLKMTWIGKNRLNANIWNLVVSCHPQCVNIYTFSHPFRSDFRSPLPLCTEKRTTTPSEQNLIKQGIKNTYNLHFI